MNQHALSAVAEYLNQAGWNYTVFLRSYVVPSPLGAPSERLISNALGTDAVVERIEDVTPAAVASEITSSLSYAGDSGAGPDPNAMQSERFSELLASVLAETEAQSGTATRIEKFWLKQGHPAYPVFWDFAFLFTEPGEALVLVGSSSD